MGKNIDCRIEIIIDPSIARNSPQVRRSFLEAFERAAGTCIEGFKAFDGSAREQIVRGTVTYLSYKFSQTGIFKNPSKVKARDVVCALDSAMKAESVVFRHSDGAGSKSLTFTISKP